MNKRIYPVQPLLGIGAVIIKDNRFLLVKRKYEPDAHFWTLPGGLVELGEYVHEAVIREIREECGIKVKPTKIVDVIDYIEKDEKAKIKYHYVLIDFEAKYISGIVKPASDVLEINWFTKNELIKLNLPEITKKFFTKYYQ